MINLITYFPFLQQSNKNYIKAMNKILAFFLLVLAFVGVVGGIGYTAYYNAWPIAVGIAATGWMAWPKIKELFKTLAS